MIVDMYAVLQLSVGTYVYEKELAVGCMNLHPLRLESLKRCLGLLRSTLTVSRARDAVTFNPNRTNFLEAPISYVCLQSTNASLF